MASGMEDMVKEKASTAGAAKNSLQTDQEETSSESESESEAYENLPIYDDDDEDDEVEEVSPAKGTAAAIYGNHGVISVLFETPSGFAIFGYDAAKLPGAEAWKHIWADFVNVPKAIVWLRAFQPFEDKDSAINAYTVSPELAKMIQEHVVNGQRLAVGKEDYKYIIEECMGIDCLYSLPVRELMWGLNIQMQRLVPAEISGPPDCFPMSEGMEFFLKHYDFEVNLSMMVPKRFIEMAGVVYECDLCVDKHNNSLRSAAVHLWKISGVDTSGWDLLKLATALKIVCYPKEKIPAARQLFSKQLLMTLMNDAPRYKNKIFKIPCLEVHKEIYNYRKIRLEAARVLVRLVKRVKKAHEAEQAGKAASDHQVGPDRKKIGHGINHAIIDELTEWHTTLSAKRKERQVPQNLAPVDVLERYTQVSSHPLNMMSRPGILSMDIHPFKDIVAIGGIDTNAVLFDRLSSQALRTLTGHSKKITSLKFVNQNGLIITGSADKTVRVWQGCEDEKYSCIHTLKDHTAEVEAVTIHASQKYFVTTSRDNSWRFYDISTGSCLSQVGENSGQEGYTSASFHPDGLILGTGTTDAVVKIWDVKTQLKVTDIGGHVGPVTAMSFSENGYLLATAALDGVKVWDLRKYRNLRTLSPYNSDTPTNTVEFDFSGSYLAIGGSDIRVYKVASDFMVWNVIKTLPDLSGTGKITSIKFGADAKYIAVGSMDQSLRIFGLQSYQSATHA